MVQSFIITALTCLAAPSRFSHAFVAHVNVRSSAHFTLHSTEANLETDAGSKSDGKTLLTTLNLIGEITKSSDPAPPPDGKALLEFFSLPDSAPLILRGSKNNHIVEITNPDDSLLQTYQQQCRKVNAKTPSSDDKIFDVTTGGVNFPGLKVMTVATIGVNIFTCEKGMPCYQFVLVKDSTYAEGNRIFVWFFNKATGKDKRQNSEAMTESLNIIRAVPVENGGIAFEANASLRVRVKFPSFLMKVIPNGKEKTEQIGGESLRKVLEEDIPVALDGFRQEYMRWLER
eukprot:CCRYP_006270-RA/>CCRYP_006270-RA protein AED:0.04 eAED:0.04 QI:221/1/1/1/1/1/2/138/286